jgi:hypothetical protein
MKKDVSEANRTFSVESPLQGSPQVILPMLITNGVSKSFLMLNPPSGITAGNPDYQQIEKSKEVGSGIWTNLFTFHPQV